MLCEVISKVRTTPSPKDGILILCDPIFEPIESHVDGFRASLFDSAVNDSFGNAVVSLEGSGWLGVAQFCESEANGAAFLSCDVGGADFSFGCRGENIFHDGAGDVNRAVDGGQLVWL